VTLETEKAGPLPGGPATTQVLAEPVLYSAPSVPREAVPDWAADALEHAHALVVDRGEGRTRRHVYLSLPAAEKAAQAARDRGHRTAVVLVRLVVDLEPATRRGPS
jgi:hypothetical protein